jgi:hypothetical protein
LKNTVKAGKHLNSKILTFDDMGLLIDSILNLVARPDPMDETASLLMASTLWTAAALSGAADSIDDTYQLALDPLDLSEL